MRIKSQDIEIDEENIFLNDKIGREEEIVNLSTLAESLDSPFVLSLNSPWGTGKTTFTRLWVAHLRKSAKSVVYFNAWETDFSEDPLLAFLGEIDEDFQKFLGHSDASAAAWEKAKIVGSKIARRSVPAILKIATAGILDAKDLVEEQAAEVLAGLSEDSIEAYLSQKSAIAEFKESVAAAITRSDGSGPIVIFVDELDRCRPTYAIALLERIKNIFDVSGLVFVLSVDLEQLAHSIEAVYGQNFDAREYLKRFIDIDYSLSPPKRKGFISHLFATYGIETFFEKRRKNSSLQYESEHLFNTFEILSEWEKMSLREIEQIFGQIHLVLRATPRNKFLFPALVVFLVVLKRKQPKTYEEFTNGVDGLELAISYLHSLAPTVDRVANFSAMLVEGFLIAAKYQHLSENDEIIQKYIDFVKSQDGTHEEREYAERVARIAMKPTDDLRGQINLASISSRINMFARFDFSPGEEESSEQE